MDDKFDFIAIGDTVTDDFIRINQASVFTVEDADGGVEEELCFMNGAKIPYEFNKVIAGVGNAANAAVSAARLGLQTAFVSDVGEDERGKNIFTALTKEAVDTRFIRAHAGLSTNYHYVLWHNAERTILIKHEAYPYALPDINSPKWVYFSSVGENSLAYHEEITAYVQAHPEVKLAFQPGTFQIKLGAKSLSELYKHTEIFFCNVEEARIILNTSEAEPAKLPKMMSALGPKISVITDGPKGAYAYENETGKTYFMPPYPDPKPPYERTGAGDACASTITVALALGLPLTTALQWGPINSMSVVQSVGAQEGLLSRAALEQYLADRPADYFAKEIEA
jgi:sugar/nucleoside kinase (ribokinase family)